MNGRNLPTCDCCIPICGHIPEENCYSWEDEFGATSEWNYKTELQWELLQFDAHRCLKDCVRDLNNLLTSEPALYENQFNS